MALLLLDNRLGLHDLLYGSCILRRAKYLAGDVEINELEPLLEQSDEVNAPGFDHRRLLNSLHDAFHVLNLEGAAGIWTGSS